jgi:hypothetical protein
MLIIPGLIRQNVGNATVADWLMGCWQRRSITFADGREDVVSSVFWLQTASHYGDLRVPSGRIDLSHRENLADCTIDELIALAQQQSSGGICRLSGNQAVWHGGLRFHACDAWPEPGDLRRTGPCLMEFAPSGAYVEDWRLQPQSSGPFLSLRLLSERDLTHGRTLRHDGLLVQAGEHVMLMLERMFVLPRQTALTELILEYRNDRDMLIKLLDLQCSYAIRSRSGADSDFVIRKSTLPFFEGHTLDGFGPLRPDGTIIQRTGQSERCWRIETACFESEIC